MAGLRRDPERRTDAVLAVELVAKPPQAENPWVSKAHLQVALQRAADAELCLRRLLDYIDPEILVKHANDWQAATDDLLR